MGETVNILASLLLLWVGSLLFGGLILSTYCLIQLLKDAWKGGFRL